MSDTLELVKKAVKGINSELDALHLRINQIEAKIRQIEQEYRKTYK